MRMRIWPLALAAVALSACGTSRSSETRASNDLVRALLSGDALLFVDFDADHDYSVSVAEVEAGAAREFTRADTNGDGSLSPIEFQNWANQVLGGAMTPPYRLDFDRNVDNAISEDEFRNELVARARTYDRDENGVVTRAELVRQVNQVRPAALRQMPSGMGEPGGPGRPGGPG